MSPVDGHARDMAETACLGVSELRRELQVISKKIGRIGAWQKALVIVAGVATVAIPVWGQIQIASISATTQLQAAATATKTIERDDDLVRRIAVEAAALASKQAEERALAVARTEMAVIKRDIETANSKRGGS